MRNQIPCVQGQSLAGIGGSPQLKFTNLLDPGIGFRIDETTGEIQTKHPGVFAGYWGKPERYFQKHTGTAWRWLLLHELGLDPRHPQMRKAAEFLLDIATNEEQGGFGSQPGLDPVPCYNGWLLWGLHLGYRF